MASKATKVFTDQIWRNNPVFVQVLGICSTLAVTNVVKNTVVMCLGLIFTLVLSNVTISLLRKMIPARIRIMIEMLIIASFVIFVDIFLQAYYPDVSKQLGPYVGLIITNCIIMGRAEAFALSNPPFLSLLDGLSAGIGYSLVLITVSIFRELLGSGTLWGIDLLNRIPGWTNWSIMVMASGAFFMLATFIWIAKGLFFKPEGGK